MHKTIVATSLAVMCCVALTADQRGWVLSTKGAGPAVMRPQASIGGPANGVYCTSLGENGVSVQDLGGLPAGLHVQITVQSVTTSNGFNPVAAVLVARLGTVAANTIQTSTFYDDDSGGGQDPRLDFVTPFAGVYLLLVNDQSDNVAGCYRYQLVVL